MVDRVVGQLSLADGLVAAPESMFDRIAAVIDWAPIRALLGRRSGAGAGNTSYPAEPLLRCLLLGVWHGLSDEALEAQVRDRLSFRRFAGFSLAEATPDHSTLWALPPGVAAGRADRPGVWRDQPAARGKGLDCQARHAGRCDLHGRPGAAAGSAEEGPSRASQALGRPRRALGPEGQQERVRLQDAYRCRQDHTLIRRVAMSDASLTDTEPADQLICGDEKAAYGDQAYSTHARHERLVEAGIKDRLMRRPNKHHPELPPRHKRRNRLIARVRAAVERPFAVFKEHYGMRRLRFFNLARNRTQCVLAACAYNLRRAAGVLFPKGRPA